MNIASLVSGILALLFAVPGWTAAKPIPNPPELNATSYGTFHVEENVLITSDDPRILSDGHWQLWTI